MSLVELMSSFIQVVWSFCFMLDVEESIGSVEFYRIRKSVYMYIFNVEDYLNRNAVKCVRILTVYG